MGPSSPYYLFGAQRRYAYAWHGNAGGVPGGYRAAESRSLGNADMVESGYESDAYFPNVAFNHTTLHRALPEPISDWPLWRPAGLEPHDPNGDGLGFWDGLSDNEKKLVLVLGAVGVAWFVFRRRRRRNPESAHARRARKLAAMAQSSDNEHERAVAAQRLAEHKKKRPKRQRRAAPKKRREAARRRPARARRPARRRAPAKKRRSSRRR